MSRSGYSEDCDNLELWRGTIARATRGKRGQRFFADLVSALDALPEKKLIQGELQTTEGAVCALGAVARYRGISVRDMDPSDHDALGKEFDIARQLAAETMYINDESYRKATSEARWALVREWAMEQLRPETLLELGDR